MMHNHNHNDNQQESRVLYELSSLVLNILRYPAIHYPSSSGLAPGRRRSQPITPAGFASLMLGISLALMVSGSVTFFIGFLLLPWVVGLVMVFYFVGLITTLSILARAFLCYATSSSPTKDLPAWKFM